jgi:hypothetical protein
MPFSDIEFSAWPTAEKIQSAISIWNNTFNVMQAAWQRIPPSERIALQTPPAVMKF